MPDNTLNTPHALPAVEVASALECDPSRGLSEHEVSRRRDIHGPNRLQARKAKSAFSILVHQFQSIIVWLLAAAASLSFILGDLAEGVAIVVVLLINGSIGFFTELRAARSMEALLRIAEVRTTVKRGGRVSRIDARNLVPGDVVVLDAGDIVTADLRLLKASNLQSNESVLTGESVPVEKGIDPVPAEATIGDRKSMVYKGTAITRGAGEGVVVATGMNTEIGRVSALTETAESEVSPLERRLDRLGNKLVWLTLALAAMVIAAGALRGHALSDMVQTGIALAVAAVPEGLPVVATLCLARGMWRMAARNAVITRLSSVETLGATTLILTDKTGTLTENEMAVVRYMFAGTDVDFGSDGPDVRDPRLDLALRVGVLCSKADPGDGGTKQRRGEPMEIALIKAASDAGTEKREISTKYPVVVDHAFDPDRKMMATVHRDGDVFFYAVKGAPEHVIEACDFECRKDGPAPLDAKGRAEWARRQTAAAQEGLRLLALATKRADTPDEDPYGQLTLVGLVCFLDPLRPGIPEAIRASLEAGVRIVMMTGDHADTAETIARHAGLGAEDLTVIEERELRDFDPDTADPAQRARILAADVFARVAPETKLKLVRLFQESGQIVAMTGDGVNDAPALKKSDIGIAMGVRGTQVARQAAHMVLKDDAFATIIAAMRQGRVIFENIRRFVVYLMSCNVSEVLVVGAAVGAGLPPPLLPLQILFLNLVTDVFPAFALGLGRGDDSIMSQPPRDPTEPIAGRPEWTLIAILGGLITVATLAAFTLALFWLDLETRHAVTVAFLTLAFAQLWNVFNVRSDGARLLINDVTANPFVWAAIIFCTGLIAFVLWHPELSAVLDLPYPGLDGLLLAMGLSFGPLVAGQILLVAGLRQRLRGPAAAVGVDQQTVS